MTPAETAAHDLAERVHRIRHGFATGIPGPPNTREQAFANEFVFDLLAAGWTPPKEQP